MTKYYLTLFLLLSAFFVYSQGLDRIEVSGKVIVDSEDLEGITVYNTGSKSGIQRKHAEKLRKQLFALDSALRPHDMNAPGWRLHPYGRLEGHWSVDVSGNWRATFTFEGSDAVLVNYQDCH